MPIADTEARPRIVLLDGAVANPGDLDWAELADLGSLTVYDRTTPEQILDRAAEARIIVTNKVPLRRATLEALPKVKLIALLSTGYDVIDVEACADLGVLVSIVPAYSTDSVAHHTIALLFELTRHIGGLNAWARGGNWGKIPDFSGHPFPIDELVGKTLGIVGAGSIGLAVAAIAQALGMRVIVATRSTAPEGLTRVAIDELAATADVVSIHVPLTDETRDLVDAAFLRRMKRGAYLINTSRGGVLDEAAVAEALRDGHLGGAAVDVLREEPPTHGSPLLSAPNCVVTPHVAWASRAARRRLITGVAENVRAFLAGSPQNTVRE